MAKSGIGTVIGDTLIILYFVVDGNDSLLWMSLSLCCGKAGQDFIVDRVATSW